MQNYEPVSWAGRQIVTCHLDFWEDNVLMPKDTPYTWVVDFDQTAVGHAVNDISQIFMSQVFGTDKLSSKQRFIKAYLQELNYDCSDEAVDLLIFDAQCGALRTYCEYSFFLSEMD